MKISGVRVFQRERERVVHANVFWRKSKDPSVSPCPDCLVSHLMGGKSGLFASVSKYIVNAKHFARILGRLTCFLTSQSLQPIRENIH